MGLAQIALDGRWLMINNMLSEILDRSRDELLGLTVQNVLHLDDFKDNSDRMRGTPVDETDTYSIDKHYIRKNGSRIWLKVTFSLVRGDEQEPLYFISVIDDITERKLAEIVPNPLRPQELEVLKLIARWQTNPEIAQTLNYSNSTIKSYVRSILAKLGATSRRQAVFKAIEIGLISPPR